MFLALCMVPVRIVVRASVTQGCGAGDLVRADPLHSVNWRARLRHLHINMMRCKLSLLDVLFACCNPRRHSDGNSKGLRHEGHRVTSIRQSREDVDENPGTDSRM